MRAPSRADTRATGWKPVPNPEGRFSTGVPDFDRLLGGGLVRGGTALFSMDATVRSEDLDLLLFPTYLNALYHSQGMIAILPARDSPHLFRSRLTRFVTRRRFDSRVRIIDYVGEDEGRSYVVTLRGKMPLGADAPKPGAREAKAALAQLVAAERVVQGNRGKPFVEVTAFEIFETLMGAERAGRLFFHGLKRTRELGNLGIGLLGPGLGCSAAVRRMTDTEFELHRDEVGLTIRGVHPAFSTHVVTIDPAARSPHVAFVPGPP